MKDNFKKLISLLLALIVLVINPTIIAYGAPANMYGSPSQPRMCEAMDQEFHVHGNDSFRESSYFPEQGRIGEHLQEPRIKSLDNVNAYTAPQGDPEVLNNPHVDPSKFKEARKEGELRLSPDYSYVQILGEVDQTAYSDFSEYLNMVLSDNMGLTSRFCSDGWNIILTSADLNDLLFSGKTSGVVGATVFNDKTIYCNTSYPEAVIHELGHYLDYVCGMVSSGEEFTSLYYSEASNLTEYGETSSAEFFAEVYKYIHTQPDEAWSRCPNSCAFVQNIATDI